MTRVLNCNCTHEYQDRRYGRGMRVFNGKGKAEENWRCTVCGTIKSAGKVRDKD